MPEYQNVIRFVPNYVFTLEEWLMGIYDWKGLKGLHYIIKGMGKSNEDNNVSKKIEGEEITIHTGTIFYDKAFNCEKEEIDELDIIRKIKAIREYVWADYHIEFNPYIFSMKLFDKGTSPNFAQVISIWKKQLHLDPCSELAQLIAPQMCPLEPTIIGKITTNKEGHIKLDRKNILYEINNENIYLKGEKAQGFSHNLGIAKTKNNKTPLNLFLIARCKGYIEYQTVPIWISEATCSTEAPMIKDNELIIKKED